MSKGDSDKKLMVNMYDIKDDKDTNLLPGNIRKNTKILGVTGTLDPQADESDATATSSDIALNKSAYVNNEKIYGSVVTTDDGLDTLETTITNPNVTYSQGKINIESPVTTNQNTLLRQNSQIYVEGSINQSIIANKVNLTADKIKVGTNILGVTGNYTSDANATSDDIIGDDKTAYVNGQKIIGTHYFIIDGTIFMLSSENVTTSRSNIVINTGDIIGNYVLKNRAKITINVPQTDIANVVNLTPDKLKTGVNILNITGTFTSDANALVTDIVENKSAYVNGQKVTGNIPVLEAPFGQSWQATNVEYIDDKKGQYLSADTPASQDILMRNGSRIYSEINATNVATAINLTADKIKLGENILGIEGNVIAANLTNLDVTPSINTQSISPNSPYNGFNVVNIAAVTSDIDPNITSNNIRSGVTILGVTGDTNVVNTYTTQGATDDVMEYGRVAFVRGNKIRGMLANLSAGYNLSIPRNNIYYDATNNRLSFTHLSPGKSMLCNTLINFTANNPNIRTAIGLNDSNMIASGYNVLGLEGTATVLNGTVVNINPSTLNQSITPESPYNGFTVVNISAVNASIDPNITADNILSGVNILGVTGDYNIVNTYVEEGTYMPVTANDIADYRVAYVNGERIIGTVSDARGVSGGEQIYNISETTMQGHTFIEVPRPISGTVIMDETCNITDVVAASDIANVTNLTPDKVRAGTNVLDITGTFTSDANATAINIKNGVTAYVNGQLIVGNLPSLSYPKNPNNAADYNYEFAQGTKAYTYKRGYTNYLVGTNQIAAETMPDSWMFEGNRKMKLGIPFGAAATAVGLTSNLLIAGANVLGIKGNANTIKTYNSFSDMEAYTTVVANCSYGIEMRTREANTYTAQTYNETVNENTGFNCLEILDSFTTSSTITSDTSRYLVQHNGQEHIDGFASEVKITATSAHIKVVDEYDFTYLYATYYSSDGLNYILDKFTGYDTYVENGKKYYFSEYTLGTYRMTGEWVASYPAVFDSFFKPQTRTSQGSISYIGALYEYNGTTWDKLLDNDEPISSDEFGLAQSIVTQIKGVSEFDINKALDACHTEGYTDKTLDDLTIERSEWGRVIVHIKDVYPWIEWIPETDAYEWFE